jgi:hypothetical protein
LKFIKVHTVIGDENKSRIAETCDSYEFYSLGNTFISEEQENNSYYFAKSMG